MYVWGDADWSEKITYRIKDDLTQREVRPCWEPRPCELKSRRWAQAPAHTAVGAARWELHGPWMIWNVFPLTPARMPITPVALAYVPLRQTAWVHYRYLGLKDPRANHLPLIICFLSGLWCASWSELAGCHLRISVAMKIICDFFFLLDVYVCVFHVEWYYHKITYCLILPDAQRKN